MTCGIYEYKDLHGTGACTNCSEAKVCVQTEFEYNLPLCEQECEKYYKDVVLPKLSPSSTDPPVTNASGLVLPTTVPETTDNSFPPWILPAIVGVIVLLVIIIFRKRLLRALKARRGKGNDTQITMEMTKDPGRLATAKSDSGIDTISNYQTSQSPSEESSMIIAQPISSGADIETGRTLNQVIDKLEQPASGRSNKCQSAYPTLQAVCVVASEQETLLKEHGNGSQESNWDNNDLFPQVDNDRL